MGMRMGMGMGMGMGMMRTQSETRIAEIRFWSAKERARDQ